VISCDNECAIGLANRTVTPKTKDVEIFGHAVPLATRSH
jgi:hypothetical protein